MTRHVGILLFDGVEERAHAVRRGIQYDAQPPV